MWYAIALICNTLLGPQSCHVLAAEEPTATKEECLAKKEKLEKEVIRQFPDGNVSVFHFACEVATKGKEKVA